MGSLRDYDALGAAYADWKHAELLHGLRPTDDHASRATTAFVALKAAAQPCEIPGDCADFIPRVRTRLNNYRALMASATGGIR